MYRLLALTLCVLLWVSGRAQADEKELDPAAIALYNAVIQNTGKYKYHEWKAQMDARVAGQVDSGGPHSNAAVASISASIRGSMNTMFGGNWGSRPGLGIHYSKTVRRLVRAWSLAQPQLIPDDDVTPAGPTLAFQGQSACENSGPHGVDLASGYLALSRIDFSTSGEMPLEFVRYYNSGSALTGMLGPKWSSSFSYGLRFQYRRDGHQTYDLLSISADRPDGASMQFAMTADENAYGKIARMYASEQNLIVSRATISKNSNGQWVLAHGDGRYETYFEDGRIEQIVNESGISWTYTYHGTSSRIASIRHSSGRQIVFSYSGNLLSSAIAPDGRTYQYSYSGGQLNQVTPPAPIAGTSQYERYNHGAGGITSVQTNSTVVRRYFYDGNKRVYRATNGSYQEDYRFEYELSSVYKTPESTRVTLPSGQGISYAHDRGAFMSASHPSGVYCEAGAKQVRRNISLRYPEEVTNFDGVTTTFQNNQYGQPELVQYAANRPTETRSTSTAYYPSGRVASETVFAGPATAENALKKTEYFYYPDSSAERGRLQLIRVTDMTGTVAGNVPLETRYSYSFHGNGMLKTEAVDGPLPGSADTSLMEYDDLGNLISETNALGHRIAYADHSGLGAARSITSPNGQTRTLELDALDRTVSETIVRDGQTVTTRWTFDQFGNVTRIDRPDGGYLSYHFDTANRLQRMEDGSGDQELYGYDAMGNMNLLTRQRSEQIATTTTYCSNPQPQPGNPPPQGPRPPNQYDSVFTLPVGTEGWAMDVRYKNLELSDELAAPLYEAYSYLPFLESEPQETALGAIGEVPPAADAGEPLTLPVERLGQAAVAENPFSVLTFLELSANQFMFVAPDGLELDVNHERASYSSNCYTQTTYRSETIEYFRNRWVFDGYGREYARYGATGLAKRTASYDVSGRLQMETDAANRTTSYDYNAHGELSKTTFADGHYTLLTHDGQGHMSSFRDPNGRYTREYRDGFGRVYRRESPDSGVTAYAYDAAGREVEMIRANGMVVETDYDALGRITETRATGAAQVTYQYDYCSNGKGLLCRQSDAGGLTYYNYDVASRLQSKVSYVGASSYRFSWVYDHLDRPIRIGYPGNVAALYEYDRQGRVDNVYAEINGLRKGVVGNVSYFPMGPMSGWTYGNQRTSEFWHDKDYRLGSKFTSGIQNLQFRYDDADQLTQIYNYRNSNDSQAYTYDLRSRLRTVVSNSGNHTWDYDANGNRKLHDWSEGYDDFSYESGTNRLRQLIAPAGRARLMSFDPAGNLTLDLRGSGSSSVEYEYSYDGRNHLRTARVGTTTTEYVYNAQQQRVTKLTPTQHYRYFHDEHKLMAETNDQGLDIDSQIIWLGSTPVGVVRRGVLYYISTDQLNRPAAITDSARRIVWQASNLAFDREVSYHDSAFGEFNLGFPGQYKDDETGLWYNWRRYYDASLGRYTQSDPIGLEGGLNTYGYATASPTGDVDPDGLNPVRHCAAVAVGIAAKGIQKAKKLADDLDVDGFDRTMKEKGEGRLAQLRYKGKPVVRLDFQEIPEIPGEPTLHLDFDRARVKHIPINPMKWPQRFGWTP